MSRFLTLFLAVFSLAGAIAPVQNNYSTRQASKISIPFKNSQGLGNLNLVVVGWNDGGESVSSVTDSRGNVYTLAVGPIVYRGQLSQSIYYAKNIAAGSNTVTVTLAGNPSSPEIRIFEYSGADPNNPLDATAQATGSGTSAAAGPLTTTSANDLLFAADIGVGTTTGAGSGFTERLLVNGDGVEDRLAAVAGAYSAATPVTPSDPWIMQMVALRPVASTLPPPTLGGLTVTPATVSFVAAGATQALTVTGQYSDGSSQNVTASSTFTSSLISVASVSTAGVITAVANGSATIGASFGGFTASSSVTVVIPPPPTLTGLSISPASFTLIAAGAIQQLTVTASYSSGTMVNVSSTAGYTIPPGGGVATFSATGLITAVANGTAVITASFGGLSATSTVTVAIPAPTLKGITVAPSSVSFTAAGATQQLAVTASLSSGPTQNVTGSATYTSSLSTVASVSPAALVTAIANGASSVVASYGGFTATAAVTVNIPPALTGITIAPASATLVLAGATQQFAVTAHYSDNSTAIETASASYASSNTAVATVSPAGLAGAVGSGTATITATFDGFGAVAALTVAIPVSHAATLSWTASVSSNVSGYNIYRGSATGGPYTKLTATLVTLTTYVDTTVQAGATYYYVATAVNTLGSESGYSNEVQAVIPSP